jgi:hypothetical protein
MKERGAPSSFFSLDGVSGEEKEMQHVPNVFSYSWLPLIFTSTLSVWRRNDFHKKNVLDQRMVATDPNLCPLKGNYSLQTQDQAWVNHSEFYSLVSSTAESLCTNQRARSGKRQDAEEQEIEGNATARKDNGCATTKIKNFSNRRYARKKNKTKDRRNQGEKREHLPQLAEARGQCSRVKYRKKEEQQEEEEKKGQKETEKEHLPHKPKQGDNVQ